MTATPVVPSARSGAGVQRTVLPNGLTVLSEFYPGVRSVALGAWVRAASVHEAPAVMGVSHLLEHLVFKGTERRSAHDIALSLESLGGSLDAYTSREHTSFQARVLDEHLSVAADVMFDLMFRPLLREEDLRLERQVVLEEISMVEDTPDDLVFELHNEALWGTHPLGYSILGTRDTVGGMRLDDVRALHARAYHPPHVVVSAAGNVTHEHLLEVLSDAGWADLPGGDGTPLHEPPACPQPARRKHVARDGAQCHVVLGSATVPHRDERRYALMLVDTLLGGGMSSRLFQKVREELGLAYSVYTFQSFHSHSGAHGVYVGTAPERRAAALDAVQAELRRVVDEGIPERELAQGRQQLKGQITLGLESPAARMYRLASVELYHEPFRPLDDVLRSIDGIHADDVRAVCTDFFHPDGQTVVSLGPGA
ncbi:MAG: insulinase family protein [Gemmatimonadetes bacterium]|nr:insulinase family protein [Gemmatimonadota bacterium]